MWIKLVQVVVVIFVKFDLSFNACSFLQGPKMHTLGRKSYVLILANVNRELGQEDLQGKEYGKYLVLSFLSKCVHLF